MKRFSMALALVAALFAALPANAEFFSQRFDFAVEKWIRINAKVGDLELQDVQFQFPAYVGPRKLGIQGRNQATLTVKNYGTVRTRVQVAIALFDGDGNLLGCGTTGTKMVGTKAGGEESYYVSFDYVNTRLASAKTFYITVETEPDVPQVSDGKPAPKSAG